MSIERTLSPAARTGVAVALAVAAVAALAVAVFTESWRALVTLPLPYRRMEIPVVWWAICASYMVAVSWLLRASAALRRTLLLDGLVLHLTWLLVIFLATAPLTDYLSRAYRGYVLLIVGAAVAAASYLAGRIGRTVWTGQEQALARLPVSLGLIAIVSYAAGQRHWWILAPAAAGGAAGWAGSFQPLAQRVAQTLKRGSAPSARLEWSAVAALALVALLLRMAWYVHLVSIVGVDYHTGFLAASDDGQFYHTAASQIAANPGILLSGSANPIVSSSFDPLYPLLLGLWYRLTGVHFFPAVAVQCLLGGLFVVVMYRIGKEIGGGSRFVAFLAAGLAAISQPLIFSSAVYGIEALYIPVLALWVWMAVRYARGSRSVHTILWLGVCGGLMLGLRRSFPLFLLAMLPWMAWLRGGTSRRARIVDWMSIVGIAVLVYAPIEAMYLHSGRARLLPKAGSAYSAYWAQPSKRPEMVPDNQRLVELGIDPFRDPAGSFGNALRRPGAVAAAFAEIMPTRLMLFFFWAPFGYFNTITFLNPTIPNVLTPSLEFYFALAVLAGIVWVMRRASDRDIGSLLLLTIGVQTFVHAVLSYTMTIRYSIPIRPYLMLFGALGVVRLLQAVSGAPPAASAPKPPLPAVIHAESLA